MQKTKQFIIFLSIIFYGNSYYAQTNVNQGDLYFKTLKFKEAIEVYSKAFKENKTDKAYLRKQIAKSYYNINNYDSAYVWYKKIVEIENEVTTEVLKIYGDLSVNLEKIEEAEQVYLKYNAKKGYINDDENLIKSIKWLVENKTKPQYADVSKTNIDVGYMCLGIGLSKNELIVSIPQKEKDTKTTYYDFFYFKKTSPTSFQKEENIKGSINTKYYQGTPFLIGEDTILFSSNAENIKSFNQKKIDNYELSPEGINNLKIFLATRVNNSWDIIEEFPFNSKLYSCSTPFMTEDRLTIYFSSNRPGGYGNFDLYKVNRPSTSGVWGTPENLGEEINTPENDVFPFIYENKFYYSSKGKPSFGGLDVYEGTIKQDGKITNIKNIGMPINSSKDDFAYVINEDGKTGYFASNRESGAGIDAIYYFVNKPKLEELVGIFLNKLTLQPATDVEAKINDSLSVISNEKGEWYSYVTVDNDIKLFIDNPWYEKMDTIIDKAFISEREKKIVLNPIMLYSKINNVNSYEEPVKVKLFIKDENGNWVFEDEKEVASNGEWSFHIRKDKEYKVEFFVGDEFSDREIITRFDESDKMRSEVVDNLLDFDLTFEGNNKIDSYVVQIGAYRFPKNFRFDKLKKLSKFTINNQGIDDGIERFISSAFTDLNEAKELREKVMKLGITDAFVIGMKNKKRVAIINLDETNLSELKYNFPNFVID